MKQPLLDLLKQAIKLSIRHNTRHKDVLRVVVGEAQTLEGKQGIPASNEQMEKIIRKLVMNVSRTIEAYWILWHEMSGADRDGETEINSAIDRLEEEIRILESFLPSTWPKETLLEFLRLHREELQSAKSEGQAVGLAVKRLKNADVPYSNTDVVEVTKSLRRK